MVGAVQFVNILDFMMVMPLGPDFSAALGIPLSHIGAVGGAYTAAAALSGVAGAFFLDRFDRRAALAVAMFGLVLGTLAGGFATGLPTLLLARVLAGTFGGPATSLSLSIVTDTVPAERRGQALGKVMGAFSVASVLGVPAGLELARLGGWRMPFFAVGGIGLVIAAGAVALLPSMTAHLDRSHAHPRVSELFTRPAIRWSYLVTATVTLSSFILIPNFSGYLLGNLHYPREQLGFLYMAGGLCSFITLRAMGALVDRVGPVRVAFGTTVALATVIALWFVASVPALPVLVLFVLFMIANSGRNVAYNAVATSVPRPEERARFLSFQSAIQHLAGAAGAFFSTTILVANPDGTLGNVPAMALASIAVGLLVPLVMRRVTAAARASAAPALAR